MAAASYFAEFIADHWRKTEPGPASEAENSGSLIRLATREAISACDRLYAAREHGMKFSDAESLAWSGIRTLRSLTQKGAA